VVSGGNEQRKGTPKSAAGRAEKVKVKRKKEGPKVPVSLGIVGKKREGRTGMAEKKGKRLSSYGTGGECQKYKKGNTKPFTENGSCGSGSEKKKGSFKGKRIKGFKARPTHR